jgi:hypothetical protein
MRIAAPLLLLSLAALCPAASAAGQAPAPSTPAGTTQGATTRSVQNANPSPSRTTPQTGAGQGLTVVRDAETGRLRAPTPTELRALQSQGPAALAPPSNPTMITGADGRRHVQLGERGLVYSMVTRGPDGKLDQHCVQGADAAGRALAQSASGAAQEARHDHP